MNKIRKTMGSIFCVYIILTTFMLINVSIFTIYADVSLLVSTMFVMLAILIYGKLNKKNLGYIIVLIIYLIFSVIMADGGLGSVVTFIVPLVMFCIFSNLCFSLKAKKVLNLVGFVEILILFLYSIPYGMNYQQYAMTRINPNTLGMFLMFLFMIISVCGQFETKGRKLLWFLLLGLSFMGMYQYKSRGTILALCCFVVLLLLPEKIFTQKSFTFLTVILIAVGTVFPFLYLYFYERGYVLKIFGKSLYTGREVLWSNMFSLMQDDMVKIFLGMGSKTVLWEGDLNVHNNFFNIIVNFGIVGYVFFYVYIIFHIYKAAKYISFNSTVKKGLIMFICSALVLGFTETTTLWAVTFPFSYFGLIVANSECLTEKIEKVDRVGKTVFNKNGDALI